MSMEFWAIAVALVTVPVFMVAMHLARGRRLLPASDYDDDGAPMGAAPIRLVVDFEGIPRRLADDIRYISSVMAGRGWCVSNEAILSVWSIYSIGHAAQTDGRAQWREPRIMDDRDIEDALLAGLVQQPPSGAKGLYMVRGGHQSRRSLWRNMR